MDEALILEKLDSLSNEIRSIKSGVLEELKEDLMPIVKQASPHVVEYLSEIEGQYSNEELGRLFKNLLMNIGNLNNTLDGVKAGLELKDDLGPVVKQAAPKVVDFFSELDGQFEMDDLADLLRNTLLNLKNFNTALGMLNAGMGLKEDLGPVMKQALPKATEFFDAIDGQFDVADLSLLLQKSLSNLQNFNEALDLLKAGMELKTDLGPVMQQALPRVTEFFNDIDDQFDIGEMNDLLRKTLTNLGNFSKGLDMLKAGMELSEDMGPVMKQALPKIMCFFNELQGNFEIDEATALLQKSLANLHHFNAGLDLWKASMEFKEDILPVMQQALPRAQAFLHDVQNSNALKVGAAVAESLKKVEMSDEQTEKMCEVIRNLDLSKPNKVGPMGAIKYLRDPKVQEAMGATFTVLQSMGQLLEISRQGK